jgi:SAM-dependent methyltransferase
LTAPVEHEETMSDQISMQLPEVQQGIQRVYDQAAGYYKWLRWEKTRLARLEHELTRRAIDEELGPGPVARALEVGCGPGTWTNLLASRAESVVAVDLSAGMLAQARQAVTAPNVTFLQSDAAAISLPGKFDRILSVRVLEYIPEWRNVIARIGELTAPGGRAVIVTKTPLSVWRGTGRERWFIAQPRHLAARIIKGRRQRDFWQKHISVSKMSLALSREGFSDLSVRPAIFGLPIYVRGTEQYPLVPKFAEPPMMAATERLWNRVSKSGQSVRRASLLFSESYVISARRS